MRCGGVAVCKDRDLIEYIMRQNRRLVSPVGTGGDEKFKGQFDTTLMTTEEEIAYWLYYQAKVRRHDFVQSTIPYAEMCKTLGLKTYFEPNGAESVYPNQIKDIGDLQGLKNAKSVKALMESPHIRGIKIYKNLSNTPVGGGSFGPLTLVSCVMGLDNFLRKCGKDPEWVDALAGFFAELMIEIALACQDGGADFLFMGDPVAVMLSPKQFRRFSGQYLEKIFKTISIPGFLHVPGSSNHLISEFVRTGAQCLSLDSYVDMKEMAYTLPSNVVVLGNINTVSLLQEDIKTIEKKVFELNHSIMNFPNFIISSGGGVIDGTADEKLDVLFDVTNKMPVWSPKEYDQIYDLWQLMAENKLDQVDHYIRTRKISNKIIEASRDEASNYLAYQKKSSR